MRKRGETQTDLGYTPAEDLPGSSFKIYGDVANKEAAAFTSTARNRPAGFLNHDPMRRTIDSVYVSPQFRGKGIADMMYKAAGEPAHSTELTKAGQAFAERVGGKMPRNVHRIPPLNEAGYQEMLPDFANWIRGSGRRVQ